MEIASISHLAPTASVGVRCIANAIQQAQKKVYRIETHKLLCPNETNQIEWSRSIQTQHDPPASRTRRSDFVPLSLISKLISSVSRADGTQSPAQENHSIRYRYCQTPRKYIFQTAQKTISSLYASAYSDTSYRIQNTQAADPSKFADFVLSVPDITRTRDIYCTMHCQKSHKDGRVDDRLRYNAEKTSFMV